jgi:hypothetical protein
MFVFLQDVLFFCSFFSCTLANPLKNSLLSGFCGYCQAGVMKTDAFKSPVIQTDDILTITIQTIDNEVTSLLNSNSSVNNATAALPF